MRSEFGLGVFGPGIGEMEYGAWAASSCLKLNVSMSVKIVFRVPPEGFALGESSVGVSRKCEGYRLYLVNGNDHLCCGCREPVPNHVD